MADQKFYANLYPRTKFSDNPQNIIEESSFPDISTDFSVLDNEYFKEFDKDPRKFLLKYEDCIDEIIPKFLNEDLAIAEPLIFDSLYSALLRHTYFICDPQLMKNMLVGIFTSEDGELNRDMMVIIIDRGLAGKTDVCTEILGVKEDLAELGIDFGEVV
jgi:hypothetical protein